jgi:hypothetical protein
VKERRPFRELIDAIESGDEAAQRYFLKDLANGLKSQTIASFSKEPMPHWGDLIGELLLREKFPLLRQLLREPSLSLMQVAELGEILGKRLDGPSFDILLGILEEPAMGWSRDRSGDFQRDEFRRNGRRSEAIRGLAQYQADPGHRERVFSCLAGLLEQDPDPVVRGYAATFLGDSDHPAAEAVLRRALKDEATIALDSNQSADEVDSVAKRAEESLSRLSRVRGKSRGLD